jgi:AAA family ATP:ADP antiporter
MLKRLSATLWGNFQSKEEVQKFGLLGLIFGLIIGTYWAIRPIKDGIFAAIVGVTYQPRAKFLSLAIIVPLVILYGKLVDRYPRQKVFYFLTFAYGVMALFFAYFLSHPVYGLPNRVEDPSRIIGWLWYVYVESFGSLIVALFWAISTDITQEDAAKRGFPLVAMLGQLGNIFGPLFLNAKRWSFATSAPIVGIAGFLIFFTGFLMWVFMRVTPASQLVGYQGEESKAEKEEEPGFLEGLKLLVSQPYLFSIFLIITTYEVIVTVFDFYLKTTSKFEYPLEVDHSAYLTEYAVWTGIVAFACVLLGVNNIQRYLGIKASLILTPILVAGAVVGLKLFPTLTVVFWIMVIAKAINYALNQPTMKQLYIPTSKDARYKSQAWIEMFGSRGSKAGGSAINDSFKGFISQYGKQAGIASFLTMSSGISFGLIIVWLFAVMYVSKTYNKAIAEKRVVC